MKLIKENKPNIFSSGEAQTISINDAKLYGYSRYLHASKPNSVDNIRWGIAIFFLDNIKFRLTKVYASNKFDIVWMRLETANKAVYFCFFYSPGAHHPIHVPT